MNQAAAGDWRALTPEDIPPYDEYVLIKLKPTDRERRVPIQGSSIQLMKLVAYKDGFQRPFPARLVQTNAMSEIAVAIHDVEAWAPIYSYPSENGS